MQTTLACFANATDFALCMRDNQVVLGTIIHNYQQTGYTSTIELD